MAAMLDEAEYASDTDESDEDYKPDADGENVASENESDGEPENAPDDGDEIDMKTNRRSRKRAAATVTASTDTKRTKSAAAATATQAVSKTTEKDELSDDDDDENEEAIWAKFLGNTGQTTAKGQTNTAKKSNQTSKTSTSTSSSNGSSKDKVEDTKTPSESTEKKRIVTEIFEFAGEKVEVRKEVKISDEQPSASNVDDKKIESNQKVPARTAITLPSLNRRSGGAGGGGGGLSSVLGQIGKKNKLSVLEKTKLDWNGFKQSQGIDEELQTHNKGRDGYLERQDFLQRTDLRQFELEKSMRQASRRK